MFDRLDPLLDKRFFVRQFKTSLLVSLNYIFENICSAMRTDTNFPGTLLLGYRTDNDFQKSLFKYHGTTEQQWNRDLAHFYQL